MKNLELSQVEAEALVRELARIADGDRYPLSPRIQALKTILNSHRGRIANDPEAEASYKACNDVLEHLLGRKRQTQSYRR